MAKYECYTRVIDAGHGQQVVTVEDGLIIKQELIALYGGEYIGDGNPEFVGQHKKILRGCGFIKTRFTDRQYDVFFSSVIESDFE